MTYLGVLWGAARTPGESFSFTARGGKENKENWDRTEEWLRKSQKHLDGSSTGKMRVAPKGHCASRVYPRKAQGMAHGIPSPEEF